MGYSPPPCPIIENGEPCGRPAPYVTPQQCCSTHHTRWKRHGNIYAKRKVTDVMSVLRAAATAETNECIIYPGQKGRRPIVRFNDTTMWASRVVWILAHGYPGADVHVLHTCNGGSGTTGCINIRHLYVGDQKRNTGDSVDSGRHRAAPRGSDHPDSKLTEDQVREIRKRYVPGKNRWYPSNKGLLAREYGVSETTISHIVQRRKWKWLD